MSMLLNLVLSYVAFFFAVSCSLGLSLQNTRRCPVSTLKHFQILTPSCPKSHKKAIYDISMLLNLVLSNKTFFSTVSCSIGLTIQNTRGCPVSTLEHVQILTPSYPELNL